MLIWVPSCFSPVLCITYISINLFAGSHNYTGSRETLRDWFQNNTNLSQFYNQRNQAGTLKVIVNTAAEMIKIQKNWN